MPAVNGQGSVATNGWWGGVATDGQKVLQPTFESGRCCNRWVEGVATNGRGGTGKMQQDIADVAIFHGGWTTVNDATAIYGSYCKSCNKVPCTLQWYRSQLWKVYNTRVCMFNPSSLFFLGCPGSSSVPLSPSKLDYVRLFYLLILCRQSKSCIFGTQQRDFWFAKESEW